MRNIYVATLIKQNVCCKYSQIYLKKKIACGNSYKKNCFASLMGIALSQFLSQLTIYILRA